MSVAVSKPAYAALLAKALPAVIHSERENERCIAMLEELDSKLNPNPAERRLAELLTILIEEFEEKNYPLKASTPVAVLSELMLANSLKQKDLIDTFGTPSIVSEVLSGKRQLAIRHIRDLSRRFRVSPAVFL